MPSPRELLNAAKQSAQADAAGFLREFLGSGSVPQREVKTAAEAHGHTWATIRRAKATLKIKPVKVGAVWQWELPNVSKLAASWHDR
jgi:hypothetical protein